MWARTTFAARRFLLDLGGLLGGWRLSVVLMIAAALYYAFLAIWATSSPPHVVRNIASLSPYGIVYSLLLVNTLVCLWRRLPALVRDISGSAVYGNRPAAWEVPLSATASRTDVLDAIDRRRRSSATDESATSIVNRWSALGTYVFHGAFFVVALGFLLTLGARQEAKVWVANGETFDGASEQFLSVSEPRALVAGVPIVPFRVDGIRPEFWRDELLFTRLEADVALDDGEATTTRINRPLWVGFATFVRMSGFGYAPRYELWGPNAELLDTAFAKLNVFPPGTRDEFTVPGYPHRVTVEVYPDAAVADGAIRSRSLNLREPVIAVSVHRGRVGLGSALLLPGDGHAFERLVLRFPEIRYWGEFAIVFDPGAPIVFAGFLLGLIGLIWKLPGPRVEVTWEPGPSGRGGRVVGRGGPPPRRLAERLARSAS